MLTEGGAISDYLTFWAYKFTDGQLKILLDFHSDVEGSPFDLANIPNIIASVPETGLMQTFDIQINGSLGSRTITVGMQSEVEVPEPSLILLLGIGLGAVSLVAWRRIR